jgi:REP-associated tyrosine transposase
MPKRSRISLRASFTRAANCAALPWFPPIYFRGTCRRLMSPGILAAFGHPDVIDYNAAPMRHTYIWIYVHVVFSTKNRRAWINQEIRPRLWAYMGGIGRKNGVHALKIGGVADHVHLVVALPSMVSIGETVREIKAGSSKWVHENHYRLFSWREGFGAFSVSASNLPEVTRYIENQEEHHRKISFADEWRAFVEKHSMTVVAQ